MSGHEQGWGQNCTEIAPAIPHINGLSTLLWLATYTTVDQGLGTSIHYRAIQGVTGTLGGIWLRYTHLRAEDLVERFG